MFKLADLSRLYSSRLEQLGVDGHARVHTSRLKDRLLTQVPQLEAYKQGRDVLIAFKEDVGLAFQRASYEESTDTEGVYVARAAKIVRKDMLKLKNSVDGSFQTTCQEDSVPSSLLCLVNVILYRPNIERQTSNNTNYQAALSISQLLLYNSFVRRSNDLIKQERHSKSRETPLPIYVGLSIHGKTRSRDLVDTFYDLGLSISYDRVLAISTDLGISVCRKFEMEQVVCPITLRKDQSTTLIIIPVPLHHMIHFMVLGYLYSNTHLPSS